MSKYNSFLALFIMAAIASIIFLAFNFSNILSFIVKMEENENADPSAREIISLFFNPGFLISVFVLSITNLAYRVLGIVFVARSKTVSDGEKALWIIGFVLMGFVTAIVFLIMAKGRKFTE